MLMTMKDTARHARCWLIASAFIAAAFAGAPANPDREYLYAQSPAQPQYVQSAPYPPPPPPVPYTQPAPYAPVQYVQPQTYQPSPPSYPQPPTNLRVASESARRPSFLPPPEPVAPAPAYPTYQAAPQPASPPAPTPETMMTQIELPVPQPTATAPAGQHLFAQNAAPVPAAPPQPLVPMPTPPQPGIPLTTPESSLLPDAPPRSGAVIFQEEQRGMPAPPTAQPAGPDPGAMLREKRYADLAPVALQSRDTKLAAAIGWGLFNDSQVAQAQEWFQRALSWNEENHEAAYGLALAYFRQKKFSEAEELARWRVNQYPQMRKLLGDIATGRAVSAYQTKDYRFSQRLLDDVRLYRPLTRDEQIMSAWNFFHMGEVAIATSEFERLYEASRDKFAAQGLYACCSKTKDWARIAELSAQYGGPLADMYREYEAQIAYNRGLYLKAYALSRGLSGTESDGKSTYDGKTTGSLFPELQNIDSSTIGASTEVRFKTGDSGLSELREVSGGVRGSFVIADIHKVEASMNAVSLDAGGLPRNAFVGNAPVEPKERGDWNHAPVTDYGPLVTMRLRYSRDGDIQPYVEMGMTPAGADIAPTAVGTAGVKAHWDWGYWEGAVYREAIKESILSYVGIRDPYTGKHWGRVTENGVKFSIYAQFPEDWSVYAAFSAGSLLGDDVADNDHIRFNLAVNKNFKADGFEYITLGPTFSYESFSENRSFFTYGHGGYFSPESLVQGTIGTQFLTSQGERWLLKGNVQLGFQAYNQAETALFPLHDTGGVYAATDAQTFIGYANLTGMWMLGDQWAFGTSVNAAKTANYEEFRGNVFFQYFFEPRVGLFETDFPSL